MARMHTRWTVPATVAVAVLGVAAAASALRASADPDLAPRSAEQLLVDLQTARLEGLSGTVVQRADLGLPGLLTGGAGGQLASLINGSNTLRVWYSGPEKARVALLGTQGETDIVRNGQDVWVWSSQEQTATHSRLPAGAAPVFDPGRLTTATPQDLANQAIGFLEPSTQVTTSGTIKVANRAAYELVLAPRDDASLVSQVRLAIDGERHVPLRVQVVAKGHAKPAFEVGFTQVSFQRPGDEHFTFTPPAGTKVNEEGGAPEARLPEPKPDAKPGAVPGRPGAGPDRRPEGIPDRHGDGSRTVGTAWTTVLVTSVGAGSSGSADTPFGPLLSTLPRVQGSWGAGHLLQSKLLSVLVTDDGRVLAGAVIPERLYEIAAQK